jgi:NADPH:quinone reductase-like Zn-dependent oxidoreductase
MPAPETVSGKTDRFDTTGCVDVMQAVVTTGNGGFDKLVYRKVPIPVAGQGEVLVQVLAAGVNNTDVNTRLGWYSADVSAGTGVVPGPETGDRPSKGWNAATPFPFNQGTDCCGQVVAAGDAVGVPSHRKASPDPRLHETSGLRFT